MFRLPIASFSIYVCCVLGCDVEVTNMNFIPFLPTFSNRPFLSCELNLSYYYNF